MRARVTSTSRPALSSEWRFFTRGAWLALVIALGAGARALAQGSVSGQITIVESSASERSDLRTAIVYLEAADPRIRTVALPPAGLREATIAMTRREFVPHVRAVLVGGTVTFPNQDPFSHNVFSNAEPAPFDLGLYRRGVSRSASFPRAGVYPVYCNIHSRMVSFVVAVPTTYVAYAGADGRFAIEGVREGTYRLHTWHERAGAGIAHEIVVPASGLGGQRIVLDARAYVPSPHLNKFGLPYTATRADRY